MSGEAVVVRPVGASEWPDVVEMIGLYRQFYGAGEPDRERNAAFFDRFLAPSEHGLLLGAWVAGELVGYGCLYFTFSSVAAAESVLLNDLWVQDHARGSGVGRALIAASAQCARERGVASLTWRTKLDNRRAQRLYESLGAERSAWFEYALDT